MEVSDEPIKWEYCEIHEITYPEGNTCDECYLEKWNDDDESEDIWGNCGMMPDGFCGWAGSEDCDFCPNNQ